jgi:DNA polymerase III subunit delta
VTPEQAEQEAKKGTLRPVYLVVGEERYLADRAIHALRDATMKGGIAGFNEDKFTASEVTVDAILSAAKMVPMMAKRRLVMVRGLEKWEARKSDDDDDDDAPPAKADGKKGGKDSGSPLDVLAEYAKAPIDSTVLLLSASKLHGQRKLMTLAKKENFIVSCEPVSRKELPNVVKTFAKDRGHDISFEVADHLAEIAGPELGYVADAVERLSLYVGEGKPITDDAVATMVTRVRSSTVWELLDALAKRQLDKAMATLADVVDPREGGLKLLGTVAWSVRQLVKLDAALRAGQSLDEAAKSAGVPPFRARDVQATLKSLPKGTLNVWILLLAEADRALKSSRRPAQAILETMIISMCRAS